jgi:hypothetical protein
LLHIEFVPLVIIGKLLPAGTGMDCYSRVKIVPKMVEFTPSNPIEINSLEDLQAAFARQTDE